MPPRIIYHYQMHYKHLPIIIDCVPTTTEVTVSQLMNHHVLTPGDNATVVASPIMNKANGTTSE